MKRPRRNHNAAFKKATGAFFCVVNPDIRLTDNPFPPLIDTLRDSKVGVVAPKVGRAARRSPQRHANGLLAPLPHGERCSAREAVARHDDTLSLGLG